MFSDAYYLLLVNDNIEICRLLAEFLKDEGYAVKRAYTGDQAICAIRAQIPRLILIDIDLSGENGLNTLKSIKDLSAGTPVFIIADNVKSDVITEVEKMGLARYFIHNKPSDIFSLIHLVTQFVPSLPRALATMN